MAKQTLRLAFFLSLIIVAAEVTGGLLAHSLALLSDAGHALTDIFALGLAWFATAQAERPANAHKTFGYHRVGILAALINAITLILVTIWILYEAVQRFQHPEPIQPLFMFASATVGIVINLYIGFGLGKEKENLNAKAVALHVFGDVGASVGVLNCGPSHSPDRLDPDGPDSLHWDFGAHCGGSLADCARNHGHSSGIYSQRHQSFCPGRRHETGSRSGQCP